jgi:F-type H+-transporting ATPase subunit epsilon
MPLPIEIVSPDRLLLARDVDMAVIPAAEGLLGVLPGHAPMIVLLQGGTIDIYEGDRITDRLFVSGGFAEITPDRCTVLADEAVLVGELSREEAERLLAEAEARYQAIDMQNIAEYDLATALLQSAQARVAAAANAVPL